MQKLWGQLKTLGYNYKVKDRSKILIDLDGEKCYDSKKVSESFKTYFLNVASNLVNKLPDAPKIFSTETHLFRSYYANKNINPNSFSFQNVSENFVYNELAKLNPNKSTGPDGINARFLKDGASELTFVITFIINLSITNNEVPTELKKPRVRPLYKKMIYYK